ncbi:MAG: DUF3471 domain-containing protein [Vicinamibacterales bacterium]|nr:DUF3471 domain-containing protein [Vicinamibacterales bacterium]
MRVCVCLGLVGLGASVSAVPVEPASLAIGLDSYVGRYELTPGFYLIVTREGRAIYLQATGQPRALLTPRSLHEFVLVGSSLRVMFNVRADTGEVLDLVFEQGGLGRRAVRLNAAAVTPGRSRIELPPDVLSAYVGTYEEQPGFGIVITPTEGGLLAQLTEMPTSPIVPESRTEFFYRDSRARITFRVDGTGAATALILHQGGSDIEMPRVGN